MMYALDDKASEKRPLEKIELMKLGFAKCIFGSRYESDHSIPQSPRVFKEWWIRDNDSIQQWSH